MIKTPFTKMRVGFRKPVQVHAEGWGQPHQGTIPKGEGLIIGTQRE